MNKFFSCWKFSLLELLIVVGIIAVLASMILPSLSSAIAAAKGIKCTSALKQFSAALHSYTGDYQDFFPTFYNDNYEVMLFGKAMPDGTYGNTGGLSEYLSRSKSIRVCPAMPDIFAEKSLWNNSGCGGYGYNQYFLAGNDGKKPIRSRKVRRPVSTIAFADAIGYSSGQKIECTTITAPDLPWSSSPDIHFRHSKRTNTAWIDGHTGKEQLTFTRNHYCGLTEVQCLAEGIGWFGLRNNAFFDPEWTDPQ